MHGFVEGARSIGDHKYFKPFRQRRQRRKGYAHIRHHARNDQLLAPGRLDRLDEIFVVPGIDLTGARDVGRIGEQLLEFGHQWAVGAGFKTGGEDGRQLEEPGHISERQHVVLEFVRREILHQRNQTGLVINQQHHSIIFVQAFVWNVAHMELLDRWA